MSNIESTENPDLIVNFYLDRLFRLDCMRSMNKIKPAWDEFGTILIDRCLTGTLKMLMDLGYNEQAIKMLDSGERIQLGDESQHIKRK